ncbi:MAG: hypothetical protein N3A02_06590, partial [Rectinema sp.]|nr:hypothetical protein [Rectinema sp.]
MLLIADSWTQIVWAAVTGLAGTALLAVAIEGYLSIKLPLWLRPMFFVAAMLLITPGLVTDMIGLGLAVVGWVVVQILRRRAKPAEA